MILIGIGYLRQIAGVFSGFIGYNLLIFITCYSKIIMSFCAENCGMRMTVFGRKKYELNIM